MPEKIRSHDCLFQHPEPLPNPDHTESGPGCFCMTTTPDPHQPAFLSPVCQQAAYMSGTEFIVPLSLTYDMMMPNYSRFYDYSEKLRRAALCLPSPFPLAWKWKEKLYISANANVMPGARSRLFYTLVRPGNVRDIQMTYTTMPQQWRPETHPMFSEPNESDELYRWTASLYGSETLPRILFAEHPAHPAELPMLCSTRSDYKYPVIVENRDPVIIETWNRIVMKPFYLYGHGQIMCGGCVFLIDHARQTYAPAKYTRRQFMDHAASMHFRNQGFVGLSMATGYNTRLAQVLSLYSHCSAGIEANPEDQVDLPAMAVPSVPGLKVEYRDDLRTLLQVAGQGGLLSTPAPFGVEETSEEIRNLLNETADSMQGPPLEIEGMPGFGQGMLGEHAEDVLVELPLVPAPPEFENVSPPSSPSVPDPEPPSRSSTSRGRRTR